ncbi:MAG: copper chaperone PCu(A)C [Paracoccus sp. (in: a-proteobacteria)]
MKTPMIAAFAALCLPVAAMAHDFKFEITDGYVRSSNPRVAAAFFTISNGSEHECVLSAASSPVAGKLELHTSKESADGMMQMMPIEGGIAIAPYGQHQLARGGDHLMFMDISQPLVQGDEVPISLDLGECGKVDVTLPFDNDRKPGQAMEHKMDHEMPGHK